MPESPTAPTLRPDLDRARRKKWSLPCPSKRCSKRSTRPPRRPSILDRYHRCHRHLSCHRHRHLAEVYCCCYLLRFLPGGNGLCSCSLSLLWWLSSWLCAARRRNCRAPTRRIPNRTGRWIRTWRCSQRRRWSCPRNLGGKSADGDPVPRMMPCLVQVAGGLSLSLPLPDRRVVLVLSCTVILRLFPDDLRRMQKKFVSASVLEFYMMGGGDYLNVCGRCFFIHQSSSTSLSWHPVLWKSAADTLRESSSSLPVLIRRLGRRVYLQRISSSWDVFIAKWKSAQHKAGAA